jgi:hypothetical protein
MVDLRMRGMLLPVGLLVVLTSLWGCAAHRGPVALAETPRTLTKEDVVNMATSDIGDDVIIAQIDATGSWFDLSVSDVIELKRAGVSEKVIEHMIRTGKVQAQREQDREVCPLRYVYYPRYYPMYTYYPSIYYPSVRIMYLGGSRWHYYPRRDGRRGTWIKVRR